VIGNLISNAIKFTQQGEVHVSLSLDKTQAGEKGLYKISVKDTGCGINENALNTVFQPFTQLEGKNLPKAGGTGLGLTISRKLMRLMGGDLNVESQLGAGSVFTATLPANKINQDKELKSTDPINSQPTILKGLSVLIAEDNEINRLVLKHMLAKSGATIIFTENGQEAVEAFKSKSFDLVLMDIQMPVMDGGDAIKLIRQFESTNTKTVVPIIALTANAMPHQVEEYISAGAMACVAKPIAEDKFWNAVKKSMDEAQSTIAESTIAS